jgi:hypothetical protein
MPEWLTGTLGGVQAPDPVTLVIRLVLAAVFGGIVAFVYRRTRPGDEVVSSFSITLVLLTILIAMVTQVIGDSVARAFSLVGALSIVRFRTVVRDTQDTAYVIFAVVVGMAIGADALWVALIGIAVVGVAAAIMRPKGGMPPSTQLPYLLHVRLALGLDANDVLTRPLQELTTGRRLVSIGTAGKGMSLEVSYRTALRSPEGAAELVRALNRIDGVQSVALQRVDEED